jgi:putative Holliday junction resolvase
MKYLGIDYGKKNIGLAISDSQGLVAMPFGIFDNNKNFEEKFKKIISEENIDEVVLGESLNFKGEKNSIQEDIEKFKIFIENLGIKTHFVNEIFSSMESK